MEEILIPAEVVKPKRRRRRGGPPLFSASTKESLANSSLKETLDSIMVGLYGPSAKAKEPEISNNVGTKPGKAPAGRRKSKTC